MNWLSLLKSVAPPPKFIEMPAIGVDVSDTSLKYLSISPTYKRREPWQVSAWGDIDIAEGALERGQVNDIKKLTDALIEMKDRTNESFINLSLPEERAYIFETTASRDATYKEIRSHLEFHLEEHVPLSPRDAFFDYRIIDNDGDKVSVSVVVYAKETILNYHEACQAAGLIPVAFEVEAQAIARAAIQPGNHQAHMIVDFGKTRTGVGIVYRENLLYTSTIDVGGGQLSQALRKYLGDVPESELTQLKNTQGLLPQKNDNQVYEILLPTVGIIKDEIATRLRYWHSREETNIDRRINSIVLCGGSCNLKGVTEYFTETLGIPTFRSNVWQNVLTPSSIPPIEKRFSYGYATAVGLALRDKIST